LKHWRVLLVANYQIEYSIQLANALSEIADVVLPIWNRLVPDLMRLVDDRVTVFPLGSPGATIGQKLWDQHGIATLARHHKMDVVHFQNAYAWSVPWIPVTSTPTWVLTVHDPFPHVGLRDPLSFASIAAHLTRADSVIVLGRNQKKDFLTRFHFNSERVAVVPHGEFSFFTRYGPALREADETVLFIGRIAPYKGLDVFLKAASEIAAEFPNVGFRIVGEGDLTPYRALAASVPRLRITNRFVTSEEFLDAVARAAIVVAPYLESSQSGIVIAAQSLGRPVVASRVNGIMEDVLPGETGILVEPGDCEGLVEAVSSLLQNPSGMESMGKKAREWMKTERSWARIARQTLDVYEAVQ
jgi:glycosyltransferase involved in cell wall biosynthesis